MGDFLKKRMHHELAPLTCQMPVLASDSASASCWQRWIAPKPAAMDRYVQPISLAGFPPPVDLQPSVSCRLRCDDTSDVTLIAATTSSAISLSPSGAPHSAHSSASRALMASR